MSQFSYFSGMKGKIESHMKTCKEFQLYKITGHKEYGIQNFAPFEKVHVDLCSLFTV